MPTYCGGISTTLDIGTPRCVSDKCHLLGYIAALTNRYTWYASVLFTF